VPGSAAGERLGEANVKYEYAEYLKGETHYIVITVKKSSLLEHGVLRRDLPGRQLLTKENFDETQLLGLGRRIASAFGLPESTPFCDFHPAKLFDFSTRARGLPPCHRPVTGLSRPFTSLERPCNVPVTCPLALQARCLSPFRLLGVRGGGAEVGAVHATDLESHPFLSEQARPLHDGYMTIRGPLHDRDMTIT
jgi:hypothetical protein